MNYWLMKSEPNSFSIDDLQIMANQTEHWDGIRNYQARNMLRDQMRLGDMAFFYHSNCKQPGIVGIVEIVRQAYPDFTAFDAEHRYFDAKSDPARPRWFMVDVKYIRHTRRVITLAELKTHQALADMALLRKGNRLSIMPVTKKEWDFIQLLE